MKLTVRKENEVILTGRALPLKDLRVKVVEENIKVMHGHSSLTLTKRDARWLVSALRDSMTKIVLNQIQEES